MGRIITVSNRLPVSVSKVNGKLSFRKSVGGVATGLSSMHESSESIWIGWGGLEEEKLSGRETDELRRRLSKEYGSIPVFLTGEELDIYYEGFCNKTIWPLFHYFVQYVEYDRDAWAAYKRVNEKFRDEVLKVARDGDVIWIHDYHLMLLPQMLRERLPDASIGFFLHIPFPSFEIFRLLPWREELIDGLIGADLVGFHQYDYVKHFLDSVHFLRGYEHETGQINADGRIIRADAFPLGIDYGKYSGCGGRRDVMEEARTLKRQIGEDRKVIFSVDRLDYTKGIPQRLEAFEMFLTDNPGMREKVTMVLVAVPSRTNIAHYSGLRKRVDGMVGDINGRYGSVRWTPVIYIRRPLKDVTLLALYRLADIGLITPLRDGMNLVAKEFVAAKSGDKGVLILSEMAGASKELGEALTVNPNNREEIARTIKLAIEMDGREQAERNESMQGRLKRYDVRRWTRDFLEKLGQTKDIQRKLEERKIGNVVRKSMEKSYGASGKRLFLLDYDGTLVSLAGHPGKALPDEEILGIIRKLSEDPRNEVVIVSGRERETLDRWFGGFGVGLVAEHGVWIKKKGGSWKLSEPLTKEWKEDIRPVIEQYVDRTPGSFLEEKEYSLVWHYRKADPDQASIRAWELKDDLVHLTANQDIGILEGGKVIEVKKDGINKGRACLKWLEAEKFDFILAAGDDRTDEDMFNVLPEHAFPVKVGMAASRARYIARDSRQLRDILAKFAG